MGQPHLRGVAAGLDILRRDQSAPDALLLSSCWPEDVPPAEMDPVLEAVAEGRAMLQDWTSDEAAIHIAPEQASET